MTATGPVQLGMPAVPPPPLAPRRRTRQIMVGAVPVGGGAPVSVQSMTTTLTADVDGTLQQIAELTAAGCQIVRVAVPSSDDAEALPAIARKSHINVTARLTHHKMSMLQDLERGRPLEIDVLRDSIVAMRELVNLETPTIDALLDLVRLRAASI